MRFPKLKYKSDGVCDFFDVECKKAYERDSASRDASLSSAWSSVTYKSSRSRLNRILELLRIRNTVRNLVRAHGAPDDLEIDIAASGRFGANASKFRDTANLKKPLIMLDPAIYDSISPSLILDTYCGLALHEAEHILSSHKAFRRQISGICAKEQAMFENLLEDIRIEEIIIEKSPGYAPYVHVTKRIMFENQELGNALLSWDDLPEFDRILCIAVAFARTPYLLTDDQKKWKTLTGRCAFEEVRAFLSGFPATPELVVSYAEVLYKWYLDILDDSKNEMNKSENTSESSNSDSGEKSKESSDGSGGDDSGSASSNDSGNDSEKDQEDKDSDESENSESDGDSEDDSKNTDGGSDEEKEQSEPSLKKKQEIAKKQAKADNDDYRDSQQRENAEQDYRDHDHEVHGEVAKRREAPEQTSADAPAKAAKARLTKTENGRKKRNRFSMLDAASMQDRINTIQSSLTRSDSAMLQQYDDMRAELTPEWKPDKFSHPLRSILIHPKKEAAHKNRYKYRLDARVRKHVAAMRKALEMRLNEVRIDNTELTAGRVHRRRLSHSFATDRVFHRVDTVTAPGVHICLLIDCSGSMGSSQPPKIEAAKDSAVCLIESLRAMRGITLDVYSFYSLGNAAHESGTSVIECLFTNKQRDPFLIERAKPRGNNHDYLAIHAVTELMTKIHSNKKVLIVISDGKPCGPNADTRTKSTIDEARKKGIEVIQVAIEASAGSADMYGVKNVYTFTDMRQLVRDMRKLATKIIVGSSE